jgi:hypothetical protein
MDADACVQMPPKGSGNRKFGGSGRRKAGHADKKGVRGRGQDGRGHRGHDGQYPQPKAAKVDWDKHWSRSQRKGAGRRTIRLGWDD